MNKDKPAYTFCIQCTDLNSKQVGDFIHENKSFRAISPVFISLIDLFKWMKENNWVITSPDDISSFQVHQKQQLTK